MFQDCIAWMDICSCNEVCFIAIQAAMSYNQNDSSLPETNTKQKNTWKMMGLEYHRFHRFVFGMPGLFCWGVLQTRRLASFWKLHGFHGRFLPNISTNLPFPHTKRPPWLKPKSAQVGYHPAIDVSNLLYFGFLGSIMTYRFWFKVNYGGGMYVVQRFGAFEMKHDNK